MELQNLKTFVEVAKLGSFTKAAESLGYAQPTVSFQIRQLEETLGVQLFDRINHKIALTDSGHKVLLYADDICQRVQDMREEVVAPQSVKGTVRVGMADSTCSWFLEDQFLALRKQYPDISLEITTGSTENILYLLDQNQVDLAYTLDRHVYHKDYIIAGEEQIDTHFVVSAKSPLAKQKKLTLEEVTKLPCILTEQGMSYRRILEQDLARYSLQIDPILEIGNTDLIGRLVSRGIGIAFLPDYVTEQKVKKGELAYLEVEGLQVEIWKQLLYHRHKSLSRPIRTAMSFFI